MILGLPIIFTIGVLYYLLFEMIDQQEGWMRRVLLPSVLAGVMGVGVGLLSKHGKVHGVSKISTTYAANFVIVTGCYTGARELVKVSRGLETDDLLNSVIAGVGSGTILGHLQGGVIGAIKCALLLTCIGTSLDLGVPKGKIVLEKKMNETMVVFKNKVDEMRKDWPKLPDWSPIQVIHNVDDDDINTHNPKKKPPH